MSDADDTPVTISSVRFRNFKALRVFSLSLQRMNVLVGPNNAGKSTIVGAFRVLAAAIPRARSRKPERIPVGQSYRMGYYLPDEAIPISMENVHTDYSETDSTATFALTNGKALTLYFPVGGGCALLFEDNVRRIDGPREFIKEFPVTVGVVPVLGPVEHEEEMVTLETVRRGLATHRASRHFRNYWWHYRSDFSDFRSQLRETWPGADIHFPEVPDPTTNRLAMFCEEDRVTRELYWAGSGFQVWCQILTHFIRARQSTFLVIDEPEIYLHPNLQRQLISILRDAGPDILLATHSSDIVGEAEPSDLVLIDKRAQTGRRMKGIEGVTTALEAIGSVHNFTLTQVARTRRILFVEGDDLKLLTRFAKRLGNPEATNPLEISAFQVGGFPSPERLRAVILGISKTVGVECHFAGIFDRDYRPQEEIDEFIEQLKATLAVLFVLKRKELENYILVPTALDRALQRLSTERAIRGGTEPQEMESAEGLLLRLSDDMKTETASQYVAKRLDFFARSGQDRSTITNSSLKWFEEMWANLDSRVEVVPGKTLFARFSAYVQETYGFTVTPRHVVDALLVSEIPAELRQVIRGLDGFRRSTPA
jgi:energy-coupling factor transporter ATP-binding protein EcfA2